jgi:hypothetical protein
METVLENENKELKMLLQKTTQELAILKFKELYRQANDAFIKIFFKYDAMERYMTLEKLEEVQLIEFMINSPKEENGDLYCYFWMDFVKKYPACCDERIINLCKQIKQILIKSKNNDYNNIDTLLKTAFTDLIDIPDETFLHYGEIFTTLIKTQNEPIE